MRSIGRKQMQSIYGMLSDDLAGDAKHRVPLPQEEMPFDEMAGDEKRRVPLP